MRSAEAVVYDRDTGGEGKIVRRGCSQGGSEDLVGASVAWTRIRELIRFSSTKRKVRLENQEVASREDPNLGIERIKEKFKRLREDVRIRIH